MPEYTDRAGPRLRRLVLGQGCASPVRVAAFVVKLYAPHVHIAFLLGHIPQGVAGEGQDLESLAGDLVSILQAKGVLTRKALRNQGLWAQFGRHES